MSDRANGPEVPPSPGHGARGGLRARGCRGRGEWVPRSAIASPKPLSAAGERSPYHPPRVVRVRVETSRLKLGQVDAVSFCTIHDHDTGFGNCTTN